MCDDDPWGKNLFENMEFDQVIRIEITQQQTNTLHMMEHMFNIIKKTT
jgi:hypothetical protein